MYKYLSLDKCIYVYIYMYVYMYICMYVCKYIYKDLFNYDYIKRI